MPRKRAYGGLLERMLKRTCDVCKGYKYKSTDSGQRCGIDFFCHSAALPWALPALIFVNDAVALVHITFFTDYCL